MKKNLERFENNPLSFLITFILSNMSASGQKRPLTGEEVTKEIAPVAKKQKVENEEAIEQPEKKGVYFALFAFYFYFSKTFLLD